MDKTSYRLLTLTVSCMLFLSITAEQVIAWPCPSPRPPCHTCTPTGWECLAECGCGGRTCPDCWDCVNCECECDITINYVSSDDYACIDCDVTFTADVLGSCSCISWSAPGGDPESDSGFCTFTTKWDTIGTKTVTATPDCGDSAEKQVTIVEVQSLLADATEFDDCDENPDTKSYYVCGATSGVVTVTATPNPGVSEENLPACWSLTGGAGTSKLFRTVSKTDGGVHTITCIAGSSSKTTKIYVYGHPTDFNSVDCSSLGPQNPNHYGAVIFYEWSSTTNDTCDLYECMMSESFCDHQEDRPPFYAGSTPPPWEPMPMDVDFSIEGFFDIQAMLKSLVHDYQEGNRSYGQNLRWDCGICWAGGTLTDNGVGFSVYDEAPSPPPSDWWIMTEIIPMYLQVTCRTYQDISE